MISEWLSDFECSLRYLWFFLNLDPERGMEHFAALPRSLRKASGFPCVKHILEAMPPRQSRGIRENLDGKPEAFRKVFGKADSNREILPNDSGHHLTTSNVPFITVQSFSLEPMPTICLSLRFRTTESVCPDAARYETT